MTEKKMRIEAEPPEIEWFANISNQHARRAYQKAVRIKDAKRARKVCRISRCRSDHPSNKSQTGSLSMTSLFRSEADECENALRPPPQPEPRYVDGNEANGHLEKPVAARPKK